MRPVVDDVEVDDTSSVVAAIRQASNCSEQALSKQNNTIMYECVLVQFSS